MQEALLRVSEAENRVAYWEKRKLERRIRAALRRKHSGAHLVDLVLGPVLFLCVLVLYYHYV